MNSEQPNRPKPAQILDSNPPQDFIKRTLIEADHRAHIKRKCYMSIEIRAFVL